MYLFDRLFVGAPRGNYTKPTRNRLRYIIEPGVVYRCALPGPCVEIEPSVIENEYVPIYMLRGGVMKEHSWFGGAMSIERSIGFLTVYAYSAKIYEMNDIVSNEVQFNVYFIADMRTSDDYKYYEI